MIFMPRHAFCPKSGRMLGLSTNLQIHHVPLTVFGKLPHLLILDFGISLQNGSSCCTCCTLSHRQGTILSCGIHASFHSSSILAFIFHLLSFAPSFGFTTFTADSRLSSTTFNCVSMLSAAWQISSVLASVRLDSRSSRSLALASLMPKTYLSLRSSSGLTVWKSQLSASFLSAVQYWS